MGKSAPIGVVFQFPQTQAGRETLARRVAGVHADFVLSTIQKLHCPAEQKRELLQAVIDSVKRAGPPREQEDRERD